MNAKARRKSSSEVARAPEVELEEARRRVQAYNRVVGAADLRNIRLLEAHFHLEPEALGEDPENWKSDYSCVVKGTALDVERELLTGLVAATANCKIGRKTILGLRCRYLVAYDVCGATEDEEAAAHFLHRVGNLAVYPYFRSHFAEVVAQSGITLPPLPVLKAPLRTSPGEGSNAKPAKHKRKTPSRK